MMTNSKQILVDALKLPPIERAELVENLLSSFEFKSRKIIDDLWATESEARIDAFDRGEISSISSKDIFTVVGWAECPRLL